MYNSIRYNCFCILLTYNGNNVFHNWQGLFISRLHFPFSLDFIDP